MSKCLIHYFSGTGGTYHAVSLIKEKLEKCGDDVTLFDLSREMDVALSSFDLHIFAFPVYGFGLPALVVKYLKSLTVVTGIKAAVVAVCADAEGISLNQSLSLLRKNGFDVFYSDVLLFPSNFTQFTNPPEENDADRIFMCAEDKIDDVVVDIYSRKESHKKVAVFDSILYWIVYTLFTHMGRRMMAKFFTADESCVSCGKCEKECPVGAVKLNNGYPVWKLSCEGCARCINACPKRAIQTSVFFMIVNVVVGTWLLFRIGDFVGAFSENVINIGLLNFALYIVMFVGLSFLLAEIFDRIFKYLERLPGVKRLFGLSFTQNYRRYFVKGVDNRFQRSIDKGNKN